MKTSGCYFTHQTRDGTGHYKWFSFIVPIYQASFPTGSDDIGVLHHDTTITCLIS